ncbi:MAG TPA: hypothetical protein VFH02_13145, partial [Jiangellaceae bacterium]|nr:hypothetical protein [Jiangellaceae bacterium]
MTITEHPKPLPEAAPSPTVTAPTGGAHAPSSKRSRKIAVLAVALGIIIGTAAGLVAYHASPDPLERGRAADGARWQAQADAYQAQRQALERSQAADGARWQAQADAYQAQRQALERSQAA